MFNIHSINGIRINVPLETPGTSESVHEIGESYRAREVADRRRERLGGRRLLPAIKAYEDAVKADRENETILHAHTIMKSPVLTLGPEIKIADSWNFLQENRIRQAPVLSGERKIIGMISDRDILKRMSIVNNNEKSTADITVADAMAKEVITADGFTDIRRIAKAMFEHHIGAMPIVDNSDQLAGILTRSDILYALINYPALSLLA